MKKTMEEIGNIMAIAQGENCNGCKHEGFTCPADCGYIMDADGETIGTADAKRFLAKLYQNLESDKQTFAMYLK